MGGAAVAVAVAVAVAGVFGGGGTGGGGAGGGESARRPPSRDPALSPDVATAAPYRAPLSAAPQTPSMGSRNITGAAPAFTPSVVSPTFTPSLTPNGSAGVTPVSSSLSLASLSAALPDTDAALRDILAGYNGVKTVADARATTAVLVEHVQATGVDTLSRGVLDKLTALSKSKTSALLRETAAVAVTTLARELPAAAQPYLLGGYVTLPFDLLIDKETTVRKAAQTAADTVIGLFAPEAVVSALIPLLSTYLASTAKWQSKVSVLRLMEKFATPGSPAAIAPEMLLSKFFDVVPVLTGLMHDMKAELAKAATATMTAWAQAIDNQDIHPRLAVIIKTMADPREVPKTVLALSHVTFVAEVTEPALTLLVPIMLRALRQQGSAGSQDMLRQSVIVVENLTRLVHNANEIKRFLPDLKPAIQRVIDTAALPEVRGLADKAMAVLVNAETDTAAQKQIPDEDVAAFLAGAGLADKAEVAAADPQVLLRYAAGAAAVAINVQEFERVAELLKTFYQPDAAATVGAAAAAHFDDILNPKVVDTSGEEGIEIVNTKFSLAYGGKMLLNKTFLRLFKGRRYGLCGRNGAGKSTLMRAIANGKLEGFPDKDVLRTCFVEHKLQGEEGDMDLVAFIAKDPELSHVKKDEIADALAEVGFDAMRRQQNVGALSGGWKMKLELARAMLMRADILLLDEPTNHLDVSNVQWLVDYLTTHTDITSLIVSHDSGFLDNVCTDIIHYEEKKLAYYRGNLSEFVKVRPEGRSYYTLSASNIKMRFPPPGILTGVKSSTRAIVRMTDVSYTYPGANRRSLEHVSCALSLSSRVAILGANGAGKSTLIKLLTGELIPQEGRVEKHPNLRVGYIAQHALAHVEMHLEKTPNQYIQWRYQHGDDREVLMKQTRILTDEDKAQMEKPIEMGEGKSPRQIEVIVGRQKLKKSFQYEIKWRGHLPKYNTFLSRDRLLELGFQKMVQEFDDHEASREGLGYRELSPPVIRKHFEDVGLDGEIADHVQMGGLSGGQLVKVVIAGAMWNNPHLLVLDEPTNYLDRDSLGGLAVAIRDWTGGVVMISHNEEFVGALCPEQWQVGDGKVLQRNTAAIASDRFEDSSAGSSAAPSAASSALPSRVGTPVPATTDDSSPADIKIKKKKKKLTRNQLKDQEARRRARHLAWLSSPKGTPHPPDTDDEE
ncbi:P-loop containing nucleoside triphosphate hydrolase protein [Dipodascopsis tothii]|uniref:P-loop containing nucleoside triphosphate hydrolase protein n=1 Tax=Dipodascopsis tothii TaxID=44089 RepID=UPI0034CDE2AF